MCVSGRVGGKCSYITLFVFAVSLSTNTNMLAVGILSPFLSGWQTSCVASLDGLTYCAHVQHCVMYQGRKRYSTYRGQGRGGEGWRQQEGRKRESGRDVFLIKVFLSTMQVSQNFLRNTSQNSSE